jgi:hypothetical protein
VQSPPTPAQAGSHVPLTQLLEQQSPFELQQSLSYWQLGSIGVHDPASLPPPSLPPLPVPPLLPPFPPLLEPLPPPLLPPLLDPPLPPVPHFPDVQDSEQQSAYPEHSLPSGLHIGAGAKHVPLLQSLLQQSV